MVLRAAGIEDRPAFKLAPVPAQVGEEAASIGYGYGFEKPLFRVTHISTVRLDIEGLSGPFTVTDTAFIGGQSGGPVVNAKGELILIVQRGDGGGLGLGVDAAVIKDRVGRYFEQN
jgi:S1-C subfamily serine protease